MYPTHEPLNTPRPQPLLPCSAAGIGKCSVPCFTADIHARVVVIGVEGKHNRERA